MRCVFMLASEYGYKCFEEIANISEVEIVGIVTTSEQYVLHYGHGMEKQMVNAVYSKIVTKAGDLRIPVYVIGGMNSEETVSTLERWNPEIIVVSGWYHLIGEKILGMPSHGVIGLHSSLLPKYRGGAPLVWQMINGEEYAGITLFYMDKGVDSGDIIDQRKVKIEYSDTIATLYEKVGNEGIDLLKRGLKNIANNIIVRKQQVGLSDEDIYPQRSPKDGLIDWRQSSERIYDFVRAQTKPYPGAFFEIGKHKIIVWQCKVVMTEEMKVHLEDQSPGYILKVLENGSSFIVATGDADKAIEVVDFEIYDKNGRQVNILECNLNK